MKRFSFFLFLVFTGCFTFKADREYLSGEWTDFIKDPEIIIYWEGDETILTFKNDSFYYKEVRWSDLLSPNPCNLNNALRSAAGRYFINGNKLSLNGVWTRVQYNKDKKPCSDSGTFDLVYKITGGNAGSIDLKLESPIPQNKTWKYKETLTLYKK